MSNSIQFIDSPYSPCLGSLGLLLFLFGSLAGFFRYQGILVCLPEQEVGRTKFGKNKSKKRHCGAKLEAAEFEDILKSTYQRWHGTHACHVPVKCTWEDLWICGASFQEP